MGEFDLLFEKCVSRTKTNYKGVKEAYITQTDFEQFYRDTKPIADRVKAGELPTVTNVPSTLFSKSPSIPQLLEPAVLEEKSTLAPG